MKGKSISWARATGVSMNSFDMPNLFVAAKGMEMLFHLFF